jgi:hypothetical protein
MTKLHKQKINRLFYGKWPYKIECFLAKSSMIVRLGPEKARLWATNHPEYAGWWNVPQSQKFQVLEFLNKVEPFLNEELQIRTEGGHFNIFCKHAVLRDHILQELEPWIIEVWGPDNDEELAYMLANGSKKIVCNKYPHDLYRYKIHFKTNMPIDARAKFLNWTKNYLSSISISDATHQWLAGKHQWAQMPFMYVKDEKTLSMFSLFLGNNLRIIEEYVLRSSINSSLDQEI